MSNKGVILPHPVPIKKLSKYYFLSENPLFCGCESQELWEWLRDHQKLVQPETRGLRCEQPPELRGRVFLDLEPEQFCSVPLVMKLAIQDIQPYSVLVSWQSRNHSGLHGYQVAYHSLDHYDEVNIQLLIFAIDYNFF